jgi:hypothetical protein
MAVSELVRSVIRTRYSVEQEGEIIGMLEAIALPNDPAWHRTRDRVHLAVLLLAGGELERLRENAALATQDWRDVLVAAGLEHDDWPEVLHRHGLPVP